MIAGLVACCLLLASCAAPESTEEAFWSTPSEWILEEPELWTVEGDTLTLHTPGAIPEGLRRPGSVAVVAGTEDLGRMHLRAELRSTQDTTITGRDVILVFGYRSPEEFYYAHLSKDNTIMPHNGIFVVDHADRRRIDDQGVEGAPPARIHDTRWHRVRLDRDVESGAIRVFVDDLRTPILTATDTTFRSGAIGFGSFDDTGQIRRLQWQAGPPPLMDPVPEAPGEARLAIQLERVATIPASDTTGGPAARINYLTEPTDGSGRLFVPDLRGTLHAIDAGSVTPYLDVREVFPEFMDSPGLGSGLGFVAFDPEFAENGLFYTVHTEDGRALTEKRPDYSSGEDRVHGVVTEWTVTDPAARTFEGTYREVMRLGFRVMLHGIQQIGFNPLAEPGDEDYGLLYVAVGDGEAPGNHSLAPQSLEAHNGSLMRIDPQGTDSPNGGYGIPQFNPFVGERDALDEIWAYGFRNPHRFSWDSESGRMLISHIGEARVDAIFVGLPGANYGWNEREGGFRYEKADPLEVYPLNEDDGLTSTYEAPVIVMDHDEMSALVGGFVVRDERLSAMNGVYLFADLASGRLFESDLPASGQRSTIFEVSITDEQGNSVTMADLAGRGRAEIRFGVDAQDWIYLLSKANGGIWRIVDATRLSESP